MLIPDVPDVTCPPLELPHFPTKWQAVLWRNYNIVSLSKLAEILECTETALAAAAQKLGLPAVQPPTADWIRYGVKLAQKTEFVKQKIDFLLRYQSYRGNFKRFQKCLKILAVI